MPSEADLLDQALAKHSPGHVVCSLRSGEFERELLSPGLIPTDLTLSSEDIVRDPWKNWTDEMIDSIISPRPAAWKVALRTLHPDSWGMSIVSHRVRKQIGS